MAQSLGSLGAHLERRSVVSVLLFPFQAYTSKPYRLLLFRRSDKVSTYRRKLAPIAGSIESTDKTPLDAAWRELNEETGLGPQQIDLWRRGLGFEFTDETAISGKDGKGEKVGRIWHVWPFAFRFKKEFAFEPDNFDKSALKLNFEHLNFEWEAVDSVLGGQILDDCVPRLEITLGQVWVDPESILHRGLEELRLDHSHGARELATVAVNTLIKIVENDQQSDVLEDVNGWWRDFRMKAFHLAFNGRPSMAAAISSAIISALTEISGIVASARSDVLAQVKQTLQGYVAKRGEISKRVSSQFYSFLQERFGQTGGERQIKILTLSSSSTIKAAILHSLDTDERRLIELRILESRPLFEGVNFAKALTDEANARREDPSRGPQFRDRLRIVLTTDASVGLLSKDADLVIIGADRISEAGDVSNKMGSLAAIVTSKETTNGSATVVCISEAEKIAPPGAIEEHPDEDNDKNEVMRNWDLPASSLWDQMATVRNVYFEWVPSKYIDYYVCENGILSTDDIKKQSKLVSEETAKMFSDLQRI
ncbi:uncharacterized protein Z518_03280 [Rhinocladiella mackenziei CBS 650.93]|uniref:Rhinocladiella mackenziei CBS 650.93 unplaced genomic scaffold supercont1.2, whole genome shotgun sequence n=1 Tax=Rhinocladiella mackenziei CBS 650.93 TaxID=1442369 RepID=A0A0D2IRL4_9EURO|nr:uncharacterized protein Z518_03280 [Rhinocladiella mackenziei CBS 650.93]KIX08624.1 hypothetical protein Z518_03280 [Rhinocladiella mackenziei CBS 650.93]